LRSRVDFDVVIAGGGAAGCLAAWRLARQGARVALVERGGPPPGASRSPVELRQGGSIRLLRLSEPEWAYETSPTDGQGGYEWMRATGLGGRLNFWLGTSLRFAPDDFIDARTPAVRWPIDYDDLAPYYDELEEELGCGVDDAAFPHDEVDQWFVSAARTCGVEARPARQARSGPVTDSPGSSGTYSPLDRWLPEAHATGRCVIFPSTAVRRVLLAPTGEACGVEAIVRGRAAAVRVNAPVVLLATSTIETARLLLDSTTAGRPTGLGNDMGLVGKHLTDHVVVLARAVVRVPDAAVRLGLRGNRPLQTSYIPAWRDHDTPPPSRFHIQIMVRDVTDVRLRSRPAERVVALMLAGVGEALALPGNEVVLDPAGRRDCNGSAIPVVRFAWDERHRRFATTIRSALLELLDALPCRLDASEVDDSATSGGYGHEVGTARMGMTPSDGVVSPSCEVHGVDNLFVVDGSPFVSCPDKNPTLTILANCSRVCDEVASRI
jgi:choline dehydrogenase-like flavoprotein